MLYLSCRHTCSVKGSGKPADSNRRDDCVAPIIEQSPKHPTYAWTGISPTLRDRRSETRSDVRAERGLEGRHMTSGNVLFQKG